MRVGPPTIAACLVLGLVACGTGGDTANATTETTVAEVAEGRVAAVAVLPGDCLTDVVVGTAEHARIESAHKVSCHSEHTLEIYATFLLDPADFDQTSGGEYPGTPRVVRAADHGCNERFASLTGGSGEYGVIAIWPSQESWSQGDRTVACAVFSALGELFETPQFS